MSERLFLFSVGAFILLALYLEIDLMIYLLSLWLIFEAVTNIRITNTSQQLIGHAIPSGLIVFQTDVRFNFDAFRVWRLTVAIMLGGSFLLINEYNIEVVWFIPWFMGFAILGAGASSVCPVLLFIKWLGFR